MDSTNLNLIGRKFHTLLGYASKTISNYWTKPKQAVGIESYDYYIDNKKELFSRDSDGKSVIPKMNIQKQDNQYYWTIPELLTRDWQIFTFPVSSALIISSKNGKTKNLYHFNSLIRDYWWRNNYGVNFYEQYRKSDNSFDNSGLNQKLSDLKLFLENEYLNHDDDVSTVFYGLSPADNDKSTIHNYGENYYIQYDKRKFTNYSISFNNKIISSGAWSIFINTNKDGELTLVPFTNPDKFPNSKFIKVSNKIANVYYHRKPFNKKTKKELNYNNVFTHKLNPFIFIKKNNLNKIFTSLPNPGEKYELKWNGKSIKHNALGLKNNGDTKPIYFYDKKIYEWIKKDNKIYLKHLAK